MQVWEVSPGGRDSNGGGPPETLAPEQVIPGKLPAVDDNADASWAIGALLVVVLLVVAAVIYAFVTTWSSWRPNRKRRRRPTGLRGLVALPTIDEPIVTMDEEAQLGALRDGEARNAIVACWLRMEDDVARAGLPKDPAETSTEYTTRVLSSWSRGPSAVGDLAALYREARFSVHELNEGHRERALAALQAIHRALAAREALTVDAT